MGCVVAEGSDEVEHPRESFLYHLKPQDIQALFHLVTSILHVEYNGGADEALVDDDAPIGVVRLYDRRLVEAEEFRTNFLHEFDIFIIIEQGVDERVVGFVEEHGGIIAWPAEGWVNPVADDGKQVAWLAGELATQPVAVATAGEIDDDVEAVGGGSAVVELAVPFGVESGHYVGLIHLHIVIVELAVLLEELVETSVFVKLVEPFQEVVEVNILPSVVQFRAVTDEHYFPVVDANVDGHVHYPFMTDAIFGTDVAGEGNSGVLLVRGEPCLGVLRILSGQIHTILLIARRASEDAHKFDSLADFNFYRLCGHSEGGGEGKDD